MQKLRILTVTFLFFVIQICTLRAATNYPVQLTAQVLPPYGTCLSDYVVDGMERINITALQRDLTKGIYQVEVRMQVKQATKLLLTASAKYNLQAGIITKLPASNLFSALSDVQGSTKFKDNGYCFPEGAYEFVFQAFDARNNKLPVSEPAYFFAFLQKAQPPYCLFPADNACVDYTSQSINLVWTEPTVSIPSNGKRYAVEIYEMPDGFDAVRDNAESIASSLPPVYQKDDLNNAVTMHQVFQSAGLFIKGRSYAWRVRTYSVRNRMLESGNEKYNTSDYVENNGYSKFSTFHFKKCVEQNDLWKKEEKKMTFDLSLKPKIEKVDTAGSKAVVIWERDEEKFPCGYEVEWNLVDTLAAPWGRVKVPANDDRFELKGVKKGVEYVTRVRGLICPKEGSTDTIRTAYSDTLHFLLKRAESSACAHPVPANTSTVSLKEPLTNGSWMTANGHDIKVLTCEMNTAGGDTTFTGTGLVSYGFLTNLVSLTVKFDKVKINEQRELLRGMVYCNTDKDNCLDFNLNNIANKKSTGDPAQMQETNLPVYNSKSDIPNGAVGIVDGTVLAKDEKGNTKEIGKEEKEEPASCAPKTSCIDDQEATVSFSPQSDWNPPFDREQGIFTKSLSIGDYYEKIEKYTTPWVAVPAGATATVVANLNLTSGSSVKPEHVYFICRTKGQTLKLKAEKDGDNRFFVPVFGGEEGRFVEVVAMADTSKGGDAACSQLFTLGRTKVLSMKKEELTLHIVPFRREANTVKEETIEKKLNDIYQPLGKTFKVVVEERFGDGEEYDFVEDGLTVEGSGVMETETAEMSMLKVMYNEERGFSKEENQAYLFLLPKSATAGVLGDMPRNKPVGYVFADPSTVYADGHTVAHEIGHGIFTFDHAFEYYMGEQGQSNNLMDYTSQNNNSNLKVWQWSVMDTHKKYVLPFLEADEDGMLEKNPGYYHYDVETKSFIEASLYSGNPLYFKGLLNGMADVMEGRSEKNDDFLDGCKELDGLTCDLDYIRQKSLLSPNQISGQKKVFRSYMNQKVPTDILQKVGLDSEETFWFNIYRLFGEDDIEDYRISSIEKLDVKKVDFGYYWGESCKYGLVIFYAQNEDYDVLRPSIVVQMKLSVIEGYKNLKSKKIHKLCEDEMLAWVMYLIGETNESLTQIKNIELTDNQGGKCSIKRYTNYNLYRDVYDDKVDFFSPNYEKEIEPKDVKWVYSKTPTIKFAVDMHGETIRKEDISIDVSNKDVLDYNPDKVTVDGKKIMFEVFLKEGYKEKNVPCVKITCASSLDKPKIYNIVACEEEQQFDLQRAKIKIEGEDFELPSTEDIKAALKDKYGFLNVQFNVKEDVIEYQFKDMAEPNTFSNEDVSFSYSKTKLLDHIDAAIDKYTDKKTFYVCFVDRKMTGGTDDHPVAGCAKKSSENRKRNRGILISIKSHKRSTLPHEVGHCIFWLSHPFDEFSYFTKKSDDENLMDYAKEESVLPYHALSILGYIKFKKYGRPSSN